MSAATEYPHLVFDEQGVAHIGATRYKAVHLAAEHYHYGWSAEELLRQHPDLRPAEVYACLTDFYDHFAEIVDQMKGSGQAAEALRPATTPSRCGLLARQSSINTTRRSL